jgi:hypothetical protein
LVDKVFSAFKARYPKRAQPGDLLVEFERIEAGTVLTAKAIDRLFPDGFPDRLPISTKMPHPRPAIMLRFMIRHDYAAIKGDLGTVA